MTNHCSSFGDYERDTRSADSLDLPSRSVVNNTALPSAWDLSISIGEIFTTPNFDNKYCNLH